MASIAIAQSTRTEVRAIALQPDGKVVAAGSAFVGGHTRPFVARFTTAGQPDAVFEFAERTGSGIVFTTDASCDDIAAPDCDGESLALTTSAGAVTAIFVGGGNQQGDLIGGRIFKRSRAAARYFAYGRELGHRPGRRRRLQDEAARRRGPRSSFDAPLVGTGLTQSGPSYSAHRPRRPRSAPARSDGSFGTAGAEPHRPRPTCPASVSLCRRRRSSSSPACLDGELRRRTPSADGRPLHAQNGHPDADVRGRRSRVSFARHGDSFAEGLVLPGGKPVVAGRLGQPLRSSWSPRFAGGDLTGGGAAPTVSLEHPLRGLVPRLTRRSPAPATGRPTSASTSTPWRRPTSYEDLPRQDADGGPLGSRSSLSRRAYRDGAYVAQARQSNWVRPRRHTRQTFVR